MQQVLREQEALKATSFSFKTKNDFLIKRQETKTPAEHEDTDGKEKLVFQRNKICLFDILLLLY